MLEGDAESKVNGRVRNLYFLCAVSKLSYFSHGEVFPVRSSELQLFYFIGKLRGLGVKFVVGKERDNKPGGLLCVAALLYLALHLVAKASCVFLGNRDIGILVTCKDLHCIQDLFLRCLCILDLKGSAVLRHLVDTSKAYRLHSCGIFDIACVEGYEIALFNLCVGIQLEVGIKRV